MVRSREFGIILDSIIFMRNLNLLLYTSLVFTCFTNKSYAFKNVFIINPTDSITPGIFDRSEVIPKFVGGVAEMFDYLKNNIDYTTISMEKIPEEAVVKFIVNEDGNVSNVSFLKSSFSVAFDKEILRVLNGMPKWIPGKQNGIPVKCWYSLPIQFEFK